MEGLTSPKKILILCHSRTGGSSRLARRAYKTLSQRGFFVSVYPLEPRVNLPYLLWLLLSFIPGMRFPLKPYRFVPSGFDGVLLVFPKWGLANPVFNGFAASLGKAFPPAALIVSFGGWKGEGFLRRAKRAMERRGVKIPGTALVKRRDPAEEEKELDLFLGKEF
ncbi:hypothetical protein EPN96_11370 [bacterium]|nr:MAG: hypothetical protein EPN96_11370 [bacterium]